MDGSIVKGDVVECRGNTVMPRSFSATEISDEGTGTTLSSMRGEESRSNGSGGGDDLEQEESDSLKPDSVGETSLGGEVGDVGACTSSLERDPSYLHAALVFLFTHVVHGCFASHFLIG